MSIGTTLGKLLNDYRAEARLSLNPAHNAQNRDVQVHMLQRVQERLWEEYTWPHLRVTRDVGISAGQRYYGVPADMKIDRIETLSLFSDGGWHDLSANINPEHLTTYNSDLDERAWPPARWQLHEAEDIEIWPVPDRDVNAETMDGTLRFSGIRDLAPLVEDSDRADLDDRIIVLYAAAETLAASGAKDAELKLNQANTLLRSKRSGLTPRRSFRMFGTGKIETPARMRIGSYKSLWGN